MLCNLLDSSSDVWVHETTFASSKATEAEDLGSGPPMSRRRGSLADVTNSGELLNPSWCYDACGDAADRFAFAQTENSGGRQPPEELMAIEKLRSSFIQAFLTQTQPAPPSHDSGVTDNSGGHDRSRRMSAVAWLTDWGLPLPDAAEMVLSSV
jgi:hypothetical protein